MVCPEGSQVSLEGYLGDYLDQDGVLYDLDDNFLDSSTGETYEYSNIGAGLAGYAIGQDLATFADQEIFTPLHMQRTSWCSADLVPTNIGTPYIELNDDLVALPNYELATWSDDGLRSNATDLSALLIALMQDRRSDDSNINLLTPDSVEAMLPVDDAE
ncbi:beta-lactamase family protein [Granulosicoccus sp.]|nr:beta-lactamase family protein [Granulosicoccus sp.]